MLKKIDHIYENLTFYDLERFFLAKIFNNAALLFQKWVDFYYSENKLKFTLRRPLRKKIADEVVFRRFQGEGVEFFKIGPHQPPQFFDAHLLENTDLSPSRFHFQWVLYQDHVLSQMVL